MRCRGLQAAVYIITFRVGRKACDWAHRNPVPFRQAVRIFLREIREPLIEDLVPDHNVQEHMLRHSLSQQGESVRRT